MWDSQDQVDQTWGRREEENTAPRDILNVSIWKLEEETGAGSQETWVLFSTLALPACDHNAQTASSEASQNGPQVREEEHPW